MIYMKTLSFMSHELGTNATLVLIFDTGSPSDGMYRDKFPVVWKVAEFGARGPFQFTATFSSQLAWLKSATSMDSIVSASTYTPIDYNQKTTLQRDGSGQLSFTAPETGTPESVTVENGTNNPQDLALGFLPGGSMPVPVYYWDGIGASRSIQTNFKPVLRAYVTSDYREGEIARGEIASPVIFEQDLSALDDDTDWVLKYNIATDAFSIIQM